MTLLRPGMKARYTLPDGSVYELAVSTEPQPEREGMNIDTLSGRDLDAEVARRLFGLTVEERTNARTGEQDFLYEVHAGQWVRVAFYTASMGASITVEAEMQKRGWKRIVLASVHLNAPNDAHVVLVHSEGRRVSAAGPLNEALCRAALKAVDLS